MAARRALEFIVTLLEELIKDANITMTEAATKAYSQHLQSYHNFFTKNVFLVSMLGKYSTAWIVSANRCLAPARDEGVSQPAHFRLQAGM